MIGETKMDESNSLNHRWIKPQSNRNEPSKFIQQQICCNCISFFKHFMLFALYMFFLIY